MSRERKEPKVYGWSDFRLIAKNRSRQTREIVAARSAAAAARIAGYDRPSQMQLCETGNAVEIAVARFKPGTVFWTELDNYDPRSWRESEPAEPGSKR